VPCGGSSETFFYQNAAAGNKGLGTVTIENCSTGLTYKDISWGSSETIAGSGGGCITLQSGGDASGGACGVGPVTGKIDLTLWVDLLGSCDVKAGNIPDINLVGQVYDAGSAAPAGICGYSASQVDDIAAVAGNSGYLLIVCDSQTLPSDIAAACISGADFEAVIVLHTTADASDCPDCGGGGCYAATAEGVE
jgi:hypothetical protein